MNIHKQYLIIKLLNRLLQKGYSLHESLNLMINIDKKTIFKIKDSLENGNTLSYTLKKSKFKKFVSETILIGEKSNKLNEVINLVESNFDFYLRIKTQINKVLLYPIILFIFSLLCFEFIRINLYPIINVLLGDFNITQNKIIIFIAFNLLKIIALLFLIISILTTKFKQIPNILSLIKLYRCIYLSKNLIVLITCGNSLNDSLTLLTSSINNNIYKIKELTKSLFLDNFTGSIFSPYNNTFINYLKLGIKSNDILCVLNDYNYIYFEILFDKLNKLTYYIQFILFSLLSINIFLIYYIVMIPMLNISQKL